MAILGNQHVLSAAQFTHEGMEALFARATELRVLDSTETQRKRMAATYTGRIAVNLFYQESTRTRTSFEIAEAKWGMSFSSTENARVFSSAAKGETLEDTIRVESEYNPDFLVLRYDKSGGAAAAAAYSRVPVINAGDGSGEHPTQALLDSYTIQNHIGRLDDLNVTFVGDLRFGRTVRSLVHVLAKRKNIHINFVSIPELQVADDIKETLDNGGVSYGMFDDLHPVLPESDIVYVTRLQKNLMPNPELVETGGFTIDIAAANSMPEHAGIMHPLPRNDEINPEVDRNHRAIYFKQAGNGLYVRMALIEQILQGKLKL